MSSKTAEPTRVLVLIKGLGIGGAERLIADSSKVWDRNRFQYRVAYVLPWKDQLVETLRSAQVPVDCVGGPRGTDWQTPARLRRLISEWKPQLVHAHLPSAGILARASTSKPIVYTEHNIASSYRTPTRALNRATYWRNRAVIAVSDAVAESLASYPGPSPVVIPNGVGPAPPADVADVRESLGMPPDNHLVVHVGNIRPHKGHANLIAATSVLGRRRTDFTVVSIGGEKNQGDLERVRGEARAAGVGDMIRFVGRVEDARPYIAAADLVVNPSDFEGLPVAILEALSYERPVVATAVGGVDTVVRHEQTGLLVEAAEPLALADAMDKALDTEAAAEWGRAGAALVASEHGLDAMVRGYESIYREILGG